MTAPRAKLHVVYNGNTQVYGCHICGYWGGPQGTEMWTNAKWRRKLVAFIKKHNKCKPRN
jgi:hypothetical protein